MRSKLLCAVGCILIVALVSVCARDQLSASVTADVAVVSRPSNTPAATSVSQPSNTPQVTATSLSTSTPQPTETPISPQPTETPVSSQSTELAQETGPRNLVASENRGDVVSVSDELDCCPASNLLDGYKLDYGEWWTDEPPEFPQVIVFTLADNEVWTIDRVVLNPWTSEWRNAWVKDFEIYVSDTSPKLEEMGWVGSFALVHYGVDQTFAFDPVRAKYVALVITSHWGSEEGITLNEFEVYEAPPGAIAVEPFYPSRIGNLVAADNEGRIVDYSSEDSTGHWSVDHLTDGENDTETNWSSSEDLDEVQYVVFAFPDEETYWVNQVVLNPYSDDYEEDWIQDFELWGSDTTPDWDAMWYLGSFQLEQVGDDQAFTIDPVALRYIGLVPRSNYGGTQYALNEFEVYEVGSWVASGPAAGNKSATAPQGIGIVLEGLERPVEYPPETTFVPTDFSPRRLAASGESPVDNIEYEINHYDLVPVLYHLYGPYIEDLVKTTLTNQNPEPVKVRIEASVLNYSDVAIETIAIEPGETVEIAQNPPLAPGALDMLHGMKNASLHIQIDLLKEGEKRLVYEGTEPLTVYSRDDFPWSIPGYYNGSIFLATMVTPNDPALDDLMRAAADYSPGGILRWDYSDDYDSDHRAWNTMKAIYNAVKERYDVTYVATGIPFVSEEEAEEGFLLQRLKLPYEVLESHSGMCVELSLLFASAFEKLYLRPILITVPGHVYVGIPISWESDTYYFLEATMVGQESFEEAVQYANESFMENALPYIEADRKDLYFWLDVTEARREGIWPIPWR